MNKRQRKKQEKKQLIERNGLLADIHESVARMTSGKIEVGDTVEIVKNDSSLHGHEVGTIGVVLEVDKGINSFVRVVKHGVRLWSYLNSVRLVKKGTEL